MSLDIQNLEFRSISKRFPGVLACDNVNLKLRKGEILALLGENGAGKTTLMNILYGLYQPDEGEILINGRQVSIDSPQKAGEMGIGMVHQHFMLVPNLTVKENVALCMYNDSFFELDHKAVNAKIREISERHTIKIDPDSYIWKLSVGEQQRVELIKSLSLGANLLILDEPTAVLTPQETEELINLLKEMAAGGCSIIFISHKLNEVKAVSNLIAVLRDGRLVYHGNTNDHSTDELATLMAGRSISLPVAKEKQPSDEIVLELQNVSAMSDRDTPALNKLNLSIHRGEILGLAGVSGNGQTELAEVINGLREVTEGKILLDNEEISNRSPQKIINKGMGYIPADRLHEGTVSSFSVKENIILKDYANPSFSKATFLLNKTISDYSEELVSKFNIKTPGIETTCASLSGGNIQKVILSREITRNPKVLVAVYPTRGLDLGAAEFVHSKLLEARDNDKAVLLVSEELEELMNLSDRIAVIYEGKILKIIPAKEAEKSELGLLMAGVHNEAQAIQ
ncbi:MAG: ABC transporter ATP-binding protein [SAR324 cluster bacterium]|nr:ABC transporter ATP-binding protein [SAR324 cluster bacterium]